MDDSINHDLIDNSEHSDGDDYLCFEDDDTDESHCTYVLNVILSGTACLNVLLPTATILSFTIIAPLLTNDGICTDFSHWLMGFFMPFLQRPASFSHSLIALKQRRACYTMEWPYFREFRLSMVADLFHASLSLVAFLTFAGSHNDVVGCFYPGMPKRITNNLSLVVGFVVSSFFVLFPSKRRGIYYPFLLKRDALYSRC
ncbi:hypothetical protein RchiOBHm_Chr6g0272621 [Rosa chinensis]|uniref:Uncharacterized protein n=1 Tax=Rosa chinensis TaxID=74649 RepID=A0A2P6PRA8_ROSCH|nr:hypothetical protein RchiOBHm_Chr6g0272621 [Rosa chinensis]